MNLSKYFTCVPLWIYVGSEALKLIVSLIPVYLWNEPLCIVQMYSWLYLYFSYEEKVACSGKWIPLFWFGWYLLIILFVTALPRLLTKSVTSWLIYEERSLLFCSKIFPLCFSDLSGFHLGHWWHLFSTCVMALHLKTINNISLSGIPSLCIMLGTCWEQKHWALWLTFPWRCWISKSSKQT